MTIVPLLHVEIYYSIYLEVDFLLLNSETQFLLMPLLHSVSDIMLPCNSYPQSLGGQVKLSRDNKHSFKAEHILNFSSFLC